MFLTLSGVYVFIIFKNIYFLFHIAQKTKLPILKNNQPEIPKMPQFAFY